MHCAPSSFTSSCSRGRTGAGWILGKQYLRCATSIGANVEEAQAGESRADFIHKLGIAQKEARESRYWLHLLAESGIVSTGKLRPLMKETEGFSHSHHFNYREHEKQSPFLIYNS